METETPLCAHGHELVGYNALPRKDRPGYACRQCRREATARFQKSKTCVQKQQELEAIEAEFPEPESLELAWAVGLFEGEGSVAIASSGRFNYTRPTVTMTMTDSEPVFLFKNIFGGSVRKHKTSSKTGRAKDAYTWLLGSAARVARFCRMVLPYVHCSRVRAKVELLMEDCAHRVRGSRDPQYVAECRALKEKMTLLNRRGKSY